MMDSVRQTRRGRPPRGTSPAVAVRLDPEDLARIDRFAKSKGISRSQALRRLIRRGLSRASQTEETVQPRHRRKRQLSV